MRFDAALVLLAMGYRDPQEFICTQTAPGVIVVTQTGARALPTEAEIDAFDLAQYAIQQLTVKAQAAKTAAAASIDNGATINADQRERIERCLVDVIRAEFNRHTDVEKAMFDAVAAATSLADLKTRYAAITQIPQRSLADLVAAIKTALAATPE